MVRIMLMYYVNLYTFLEEPDKDWSKPVSYTHLGMRVDYRKKGFVLFNRNLNVLGNVEHARLEELPLERFNVEEIPLEGEIVEEHAGFTLSLIHI